MAQSAKMDYFRAVTTEPSLINAQAKGYFSDENTEIVQVPLYGYRLSVRHKDSSAFYCANPHTDSMGNLVQFSGSPIAQIMDSSQCTSIKIPFVTGCHDWKVTRIDLAIDWFNDSPSMERIYEHLELGAYKSKIRVWKREKETITNGLDIIRGGGKEATRSLKIYNKAAEQGVDGMWNRLEMTFTDARAREIWAQVRDLTDDVELLQFAKKVLATMLDFPDWQEWQEAFGIASKHDWQPIPRTESDHWRWLMRQVAPAFREAAHKDGNWGLLEKFIAEVKRIDDSQVT